MKSNFIIYLLLLTSFVTYSQIDGSLLLGLTNATSAEMNAVTNPSNGSLIYNSDEQRVYQFNGSNWDELQIKKTPTIATKTASYTLTVADNGNVLTFNSSTDITLVASAGLPIGFNVSLYQIGDGQITILGAAGVTLKNRLSRFKTAGKDAGVGLICTSADVFHLTGDLKK